MEFELPADFKGFLESLNRHAVKYLLIGGYAVGLHGYPRATNDMDVVVADDPDNAKKVVGALKDFGFGDAGISESLFTNKNSLVVMGVEPVAIDILNYLEGCDFEDAYGRRKSVTVEDVQINLISFEDLLLNKRSVARSKDLVDVEELQKRNI